jgi:hypothetical protein
LIDNLSLHALTGPYQRSMPHGIPDWQWLTICQRLVSKLRSTQTAPSAATCRRARQPDGTQTGLGFRPRCSARLHSAVFRQIYASHQGCRLLSHNGAGPLSWESCSGPLFSAEHLNYNGIELTGTEICRDGASQPFCDRIGGDVCCPACVQELLDPPRSPFVAR